MAVNGDLWGKVGRAALAMRRVLRGGAGAGLALGLIVRTAFAQDTAVDLQREQRARIEQWQRQAQQPVDLPPAAAPPGWLPPITGEQPCVLLQAVQITVPPWPDGAGAAAGVQAAPPPVPPTLLAAPADFIGRCLGPRSLQRLQANLQGRLQALGYITSTLQLPEQDLAAGVLRLDLRWGRVGAIRVRAEPAPVPDAAVPAMGALALQPGDVLNLRDLEHSIENLARLPSQAARLLIEPGQAAQLSDLQVVFRPGRPWRASLGLEHADDRSGSPWDLQAQYWLDAPLGRSDQLLLQAAVASAGRGNDGAEGLQRHSLYLQWSLPLGRHLLTMSASQAGSGRRIAGGVGRFDESSREQQASLRWQWTPWRGPDWRTQLWLAWTHRRSRSRIDTVELLGRRRVADELGIGASHWRRTACGEASVQVDTTGTRRLARVAGFQDPAAPLPRQWRVQADLRGDLACSLLPLRPASVDGGIAGAEDVAAPTVPDSGWSWTLSAFTQAAERPFDGSDLHTIGSRWTVRGHDATQALQGQRVSVLRASLAAPAQQAVPGLVWQPWLGWDAGRVDRALAGTGPAHAADRSRQAAVLGLRWGTSARSGASGELVWARAIGHLPAPPPGRPGRTSHWLVQTQWSF